VRYIGGVLVLALTWGLASFSYCDEQPTKGPSSSIGSPSNGRVEGARKLVDGAHARVMPLRHKERCLSWGTKRLIAAIESAAKRVSVEHPGGFPLGVGNIGRARGGPIRDYSHSHQAGRDVDLAFYLDGKAADDLVKIGDDLAGLDVVRTWALARALLEDKSINVRWMFVSPAIKRALLDEAARTGAPSAIVKRAREVLHQPSDAPAHDDHLHLRIRCTAVETRGGCRD
jgi:penicillin-insensitive murein endopeptidase